MPKIHVKLDRKAVQRFSDVVHDPGDPLCAEIDGRDIQSWVKGCSEDPGITVGQAETLNDLDTEGVTLCIDEDGTLTVVER